MAATQEDINRWMQKAIIKGVPYIVSVCDTFDYEDYPVYCKDEEELEEAKAKYDGINMQRINEIITI